MSQESQTSYPFDQPQNYTDDDEAVAQAYFQLVFSSGWVSALAAVREEFPNDPKLLNTLRMLAIRANAITH